MALSYQGDNTGAPAQPDLMTNLDANGNLLSNYTLNAQPGLQFHGYMDDENQHLGDIPQLNTDPLHQLENFAQGSGDSPWAQAQLQSLQQAQGQAMGASAAKANSANTQGLDAMATRGGLSRGAMQNMARNASNNSLMAGQNVIGQGLQQQGNIRTTDEQNRLSALSNLPGQEVQSLQPALQKQSLWQQAAAQNQAQEQTLDQQQQAYRTAVDQANMTNKMSGLTMSNQNALEKYKQDVALQAGHEQAQAEAGRGKK